MNQHNYRFTVLRAVPSLMRGERVNVGIAVFHPDGDVAVHVGITRNRSRSFDPRLGAIDWQVWQEQVHETLQELPLDSRKYWLMHGLSPIVADEEMGSFRVDGEMSYSDAVGDLLRRLVSVSVREHQPRLQVAQAPRLKSQLKTWFKAQRIMGSSLDDLYNRRIVEAFPISDETDTVAEFAFMNGSVHVMETLDLRDISHLTQQQKNKAAFKSVVLHEARALPNVGRRIAVVAATDYQTVRPVVRMVEHAADDMFHMESAEDVHRLVGYIGEALHQPSQLDARALVLPH